MKLDELANDARTLDDGQFRERHGAAFLYHAGPTLQPPDIPRGTVVGGPPRRYDPLAKPQPDWLVFPVKRTGRCPFPSMIAIGRAANNDVVLLDISISKFHAYFKEVEGGGFTLQDAGSRNGTYVGDSRIPTVKEGSPFAVVSGSRVRFGHVVLTFVHARDLKDIAARHG
jgi:hypothetical protein